MAPACAASNGSPDERTGHSAAPFGAEGPAWVPPDDLVGAPEVGDPRIRFEPGRVKGRTVIPLNRQPDGMRVWKIVIPAGQVTPEPRAHDGWEWVHVSSDLRAPR